MPINYAKLFSILERYDLTLSELGRILHISSATLSKINKGEYVSLRTLEKIARHLNVQFGDIIEYTEDYVTSPLLRRLLDEKNNKIKGGIYHETQILLTYNSNHIEGSKLTLEQTRHIFETNALLVDEKNEYIDISEINETINHFRAIDYMLDIVFEPLTTKMIKDLHLLLKRNTKDERLAWFNVGEYKLLPNEVGGSPTTAPEDVAGEMTKLINNYEQKQHITFNDIAFFHYNFARIHPFQDGNCRMGRLIAFKEALRFGEIPFTINEELKLFYDRSFARFKEEQGFLLETLRTGQDLYKAVLERYRISY